jgi:hypothetical protein
MLALFWCRDAESAHIYNRMLCVGVRFRNISKRLLHCCYLYVGYFVFVNSFTKP